MEADESARCSGRCPMHGGARARRHTRVAEVAVRSRRRRHEVNILSQFLSRRKVSDFPNHTLPTTGKNNTP